MGTVRGFNRQDEVLHPQADDGTHDRNASSISNQPVEGRKRHAGADLDKDVAPFSASSLQCQTYEDSKLGPLPKHQERRDVTQQYGVFLSNITKTLLPEQPASDWNLTLQRSYPPSSYGLLSPSFRRPALKLPLQKPQSMLQMSIAKTDDDIRSSVFTRPMLQSHLFPLSPPPTVNSRPWSIVLSEIALQAQTGTVNGVLFGLVDNDQSMMMRLESTRFIKANS